MTLRVLLAIFMLSMVVQARAASVPGGVDNLVCGPEIAAAERQGKLPNLLLATIAMVESGRLDPVTHRFTPWPWAINVEGKPYFYETKDAVITAVEEFRKGGARSIDVGCMQINLQQHPNAFTSLDEAFDPHANVTYGARFLSSLFRQLGTWPDAIAAYHSQTPAIGTEYLARILSRWTLADVILPGVRAASMPLAAAPSQADLNRTTAYSSMVRQADEDHQRLLAAAGVASPRAPRTQAHARVDRGARIALLN